MTNGEGREGQRRKSEMKTVRIRVSKKDAQDFKDKEFFENVLRVLIAKRNAIERRIARIKRKLPAQDLEQLQNRLKREKADKLSEALAMVREALDKKDFGT